MTTPPIQAIEALTGPNGISPSAAVGLPAPSDIGSFSQMLLNGVNHVNQKLADAEKLSTSFALDDSVPLHQVTFALQEARMSLEFMLQVRSRLVEAYQQFASMQL